jgi:hypothetical protein
MNNDELKAYLLECMADDEETPEMKLQRWAAALGLSARSAPTVADLRGRFNRSNSGEAADENN